jgi:plastocyanin
MEAIMKLMRFSVLLGFSVAIGCSGGGGSTDPGGGGGGGGGGGTNTTCPANTVCMLSSTFSPTSLTVTTGTTVTFHNGSGIDHTVNFDEARPPGVTDVPLNNSGDFPRTFNSVGTYNFHCTQHIGMTGRVVVN